MEKIKAILIRFLKGAIAGAVSSMALVTLKQPAVWVDFNLILNSLAIAGTFGAITGLLLAVEKWASWSDSI